MLTKRITNCNHLRRRISESRRRRTKSASRHLEPRRLRTFSTTSPYKGTAVLLSFSIVPTCSSSATTLRDKAIASQRDRNLFRVHKLPSAAPSLRRRRSLGQAYDRVSRNVAFHRYGRPTSMCGWTSYAIIK